MEDGRDGKWEAAFSPATAGPSGGQTQCQPPEVVWLQLGGDKTVHWPAGTSGVALPKLNAAQRQDVHSQQNRMEPG